MGIIKRYWKWPLSLDVIWLLVPLMGIIARLSVDAISPYDYWWSLAMGRIIALSGQIPETNMFMYTLDANAGFFNQPWLAQWLMYVLYDSIGHTGLMLVRNGIVALTWIGVLGLALKRCEDARIVGGLSLAVVVVGGVVFGVRTQMFAFLPFVATLVVLVLVVENRISRYFAWGLLPIVTLWANLHGTFILAPVMAGCVGGGYLLERFLTERRIEVRDVLFWSGLTIGLGLAALINPYGVGLYGYVFNLFVSSGVSEGVSEWQPVDPMTGLGVLVVVLMASSLVILLLCRKSVKIWEVLLFCAMAYLGMSSMRSLFWWAAVWLVVIPRHLEALITAKAAQPVPEIRPIEGVIHAAMVVMIGCIGIGIQPTMPIYEVLRTEVMADKFRHEPGAEALNELNCVSLIDLLKERGYPGRIFHHQAIGGLLEFGLTEWDSPRAVSFVDQRIELIPESVWVEYFALGEAEEGWDRLVKKYGIETFILSRSEQPKLISTLSSDPAWREVWSDDVYQVFFSASGAGEFTQWRLEPTEIDIAR